MYLKAHSDVLILLQITQHKMQGKSTTLVWMRNLQQLEIFLIVANYTTYYLCWFALSNFYPFFAHIRTSLTIPL